MSPDLPPICVIVGVCVGSSSLLRKLITEDKQLARAASTRMETNIAARINAI
jgi:hypothetical protein